MLFGRTKKPAITLRDKGVVEWKYATCGYCSTGCSMEVGLNAAGKAVTTRGVADAPVNQGKLCIKGITEADDESYLHDQPSWPTTRNTCVAAV